MDDPDRATYEVREGRFLVNGKALPLRKGLIIQALARAGWHGDDGVLSLEMARKTLLADPRIDLLTRRSA